MNFTEKISRIFEKVDVQMPLKAVNLARKKFMVLFIEGLIKGRSVQFIEIANHMSTQVKTESNLRRIQDFMANYKLNYEQIALLLCCFLPTRGQIKLAIDRTNWQFGQCDINFLVISAHCQGAAIPLWFELLEDKQGGNSNEAERIAVLKACLKSLPNRSVAIIADREFVGSDWIGFLFNSEVDFYIRLRHNTLVEKGGQIRHASEWLGERKKCLLDGVKIHGHWVSLAIKRLTNQDDEYLIVMTNTFAYRALDVYHLRWSIETFFQSVKQRGFHLEDTHLDDLERLRKLFALVAIAFAVCLHIGRWSDQNIKPIEIKNHGYKANSFFRHGLECWRRALRTLTYELNLFIEVIAQILNPPSINTEKFLT
jgi:Transposase DDE domain